MNQAEKNRICELIKQNEKTEIVINYILKSGAAKRASKIGGKPDVPKDFEWPVYEGKDFEDIRKERPLSFIIQINLKDVAPYDKEELLPKQGILSFFYEMRSMDWGYDPANKGCAKVYYFPDENELETMDFPAELEKDAIISEMKIVRIKNEESLPVYEQLLPDLEKLKKTEGIVCDDLDDYDECLQSCGVPIFEEGMEYYYEWAYRRIKLLGNPDVLQDRMEEECEGVTRGYYLGRGWQDVPEQEREEIWEKSKDWMLLFQVGTIDGYDGEYRWGDQGNLYFWIKKQDLKMRNFENVWLILQCL